MRYAYLPLAGLLLTTTACSTFNSTTPVTSTVTTVQADTKLLVDGFSAIVPMLTQAGVSPTLVAQIQQDMQTAEQYEAQLSTLNNVDQANSTGAKIVTAIQDALKVAAALGVLPPGVQTVVNAANAFLPVIMSELGLPLPASASAVSMSQANAREVLRGAAGH